MVSAQKLIDKWNNFRKSVNTFLFSFSIHFVAGITDHTNILPASLISPMGTENSSYDYNIFDSGTESLLDVWADGME